MVSILVEPAAQALDVGTKVLPYRAPLGLIEHGVRRLQRTRSSVRERAPVEQARIPGVLRDGVAKRVARIPGGAPIEVRPYIVDARSQDLWASATQARTRRMLIRLRIAGGSASRIAAACSSSAVLCGEPASADA